MNTLQEKVFNRIHVIKDEFNRLLKSAAGEGLFPVVEVKENAAFTVLENKNYPIITVRVFEPVKVVPSNADDHEVLEGSGHD